MPDDLYSNKTWLPPVFSIMAKIVLDCNFIHFYGGGFLCFKGLHQSIAATVTFKIKIPLFPNSSPLKKLNVASCNLPKTTVDLRRIKKNIKLNTHLCHQWSQIEYVNGLNTNFHSTEKGRRLRENTNSLPRNTGENKDRKVSYHFPRLMSNTQNEFRTVSSLFSLSLLRPCNIKSFRYQITTIPNSSCLSCMWRVHLKFQ